MPEQFAPRDGQTDFTHIRWAPVINCIVRYRDKILLVQRSDKLTFYPGYWNGISGFLDDHKSLEEKVKEELQEELSVPADHIVSITSGGVFDQDEPVYHKTWIVHPVLAEIRTDQIKLDWEGVAHRWVAPADARTMKLLPGFDRVLDSFF